MNFLLDSAEGARAMAELQSVLVVENDETQALLARHALMERVRNRVHCVATVVDMFAYLNGVAYYHDRAEYPLPGVILLNLDLPGVDGFDALVWLRASAKFARIPVIVMGTEAKIEALHAAMRAGADGWMFAPLDTADFHRVAEELKSPVVFRSIEPSTETLPKAGTFPMLTA